MRAPPDRAEEVSPARERSLDQIRRGGKGGGRISGGRKIKENRPSSRSVLRRAPATRRSFPPQPSRRRVEARPGFEPGWKTLQGFCVNRSATGPPAGLSDPP